MSRGAQAEEPADDPVVVPELCLRGAASSAPTYLRYTTTALSTSV